MQFCLIIPGTNDQNPALGYRPGNIGGPDAPSTPGAFASGLIRNEGTIPGVGAAMPLSLPTLDSSSQGDQKNPLPLSMPMGAPPLPPGPHPSLRATNQQQGYQQNMQQVPQQQNLPQQMNSMPMLPLQPPSHMPMMQHPHLARPPPQLQPINMQGVQSSMPGSMPVPSMPMPGPMVLIFPFS